MSFSLRDLLSFQSSFLCSLITLGILILIPEKTCKTQIMCSHGTVLLQAKDAIQYQEKEYAFKLCEDFTSMFLCILVDGWNKTCFVSGS